MQQELKALERRWGLAVQTARFGVWDLDVKQQRVHYTPEWKAMLGYCASDEADDTSAWRERVHPDDLAPMLQAQQAHLSGRSVGYECEFRLRAADGAYRWVLSRGRTVAFDALGQPLRVIGTLTDVTDRHELEALRQQRDAAEAKNQAKTEFLSRMSHELRTPLNAVLGFAQLLSRRAGDHDPDAQRYVRHIEQAGWHLLAMINDVLDLSRAETGTLNLETTSVALGPLWDEVRDMMAPIAAQQRVAMHTGPLAPQAAVRADRTRLKQVMTNLCSNAVKYNREGGSMTLDITAVDAGWCIALSDTGIGMSRDQLAHLFEPFNRLGRAASGIAGVGIGLVLTRWLVLQMGGTVEVRSTPGAGSTFAVTLPAAGPGQAPAQPPDRVSAPAPAAAPAPTANAADAGVHRPA
jgi:PAS domain S-box-containing protein